MCKNAEKAKAEDLLLLFLQTIDDNQNSSLLESRVKEVVIIVCLRFVW